MQIQNNAVITRDVSPSYRVDVARGEATETQSFENEHGALPATGSPCSCPGCYPDPIW